MNENKKVFYVVDEHDGSMDSMSEHYSLDSVKEILYNVWSQDDSEEGWTVEEIDSMNIEETNDAIGGIGYSMSENKKDALESVEFFAVI